MATWTVETTRLGPGQSEVHAYTVPNGSEALLLAGFGTQEWDQAVLTERHIELQIRGWDGQPVGYILPRFNAFSDAAGAETRLEFSLYLGSADKNFDFADELPTPTIRSTEGMPAFYWPEKWSFWWVNLDPAPADQTDNLVLLVDVRVPEADEEIEILGPFRYVPGPDVAEVAA